MSKQIIGDGAQLRRLYRSYGRWLSPSCGGLGKRPLESTFMGVVEPFSTLFFDAYGVLYGGSVEPAGVAQAMALLRRQDKCIRLLSNNGHESVPVIVSKLAAVGLFFEPHEIITSGMVVASYLARGGLRGAPYLLIGSEQSRQAYAPEPMRLERPPGDARLGLEPPRVLLVCSDSAYWGTPYQAHVESILAVHPLPMLVANPDLVVPLPEGGWLPVAGHAALTLNQRYGAAFIGLGKPFRPVFERAMASVPGVKADEILMIGDTPETDILGANGMGIKSCLVGSGILAKMDLTWYDYCVQQGIMPDFYVPAVAC
ncbi:Haloacid dehalogenase domain protein hydrolase [Magnetococcus marinus MC-1]|uniref:Haloacid dehalogenase domain protein hydrolase n=1 Tax=Magnetococcus marinus (strain ATCC BAA-1437 / JCM 17883 / MC-1) TaxID=156889 RepID=A0L4T0_MAGMM|nr:HAD hydrolase-like protein [Magnetococcus marinus]ABK42973.1 Haloacid dehalogenase domain protein hydrolase [Magnetococcus marinus MC-1]